MKCLAKVLLSLGVVFSAVLVVAQPATAQTITTGNLSGTVADQQSKVLPGTTIDAVHVATGTVYSTVAEADGHFSILNVRIGSYTVTATLSGFKKEELKDIVVSLGEERTLAFKLQIAAMTDSVTVTAESTPIDVTRAGTGANISNGVKELLPTITRGLTDIARVNPYFNPMGRAEEPAVPSVAGRSQRYNSLQIDGAVNNDLFGLAGGSGVPGGAAGTQPISLDAIQELQLVVSPYDIRQSGFSGGGINAVTKTGTNQYKGTVFYFGRNQSWVGKGVSGVPISTFSDKQTGFSIGGPIAQRKAFFFATVDVGRKSTPSGFSVNSTGVKFAAPGAEALVDRFLTGLKNLYGYDIGPTAKDEFIKTTDNNKVFLRTDFNLGRHQLTVRHNYVNGSNDIGTSTQFSYTLPDGFYHVVSKTNSTVGQLTTRMGRGVNEFRFTYTTVRDHRNGQGFEPKAFPFVSVIVSPGFTLSAGRENFSGANELDQDIVELTNDYTRVMGRHTVTLGTHNEFVKIRNLFIRDFFGNYGFDSLDLFEQGTAQIYSHSFSSTSDPFQSAKFRANQYGFYAGDQWRAKSNLTTNVGVRVDVLRFPNKPNPNPLAVSQFGFATDVVADGVMWSPRAGFNWDLSGNGSEQIRGGVGVFSGRPAYVWISNQYGNTGVDFGRVSTARVGTNRIPFVADAAAQPATVTGGTFATNEIDLIDPNFKYPSILRGNLAYDRKLPWGLYGSAELVWSSTLQDIQYKNLNLVEDGTVTLDRRPHYRRLVTSLSDVLLLTNTTKGHAWNLAFELKRPFKSGVFLSGSYLYGRASTIMDGIRDQALSGWGNIYAPGNPNDPPMARSDYDPGHRVNVSGSYDFRLIKGASATFSMFYSGQSGRPFTLSYNNRDVNGDFQVFNDNLYLPKPGDALPITGGTSDDLLRFFQQRECTLFAIGTIAQRNACRAPWINTFDARLTVNLPFKKVRAEITLDMLNLINLIDSKKGLFQYANFNQFTFFTPTITNGQVTSLSISPITAANFNPFTRSDLRSRWQMQLGGRLRF